MPSLWSTWFIYVIGAAFRAASTSHAAAAAVGGGGGACSVRGGVARGGVRTPHPDGERPPSGPLRSTPPGEIRSIRRFEPRFGSVTCRNST
jgi:hypothetical protein